MAFNIDEFNAELSQSGVASAAHFEAWILGGPGSYYGLSNILQQYGLEGGMRFRIESLNMPGRNLQTLDQNYYGPTRRVPYRFTQQPVTMSVILSKDMREREVFMKWQDFFVGHYRTREDGRGVIPGQFDTKYYDEGIGTVAILQMSQPMGTDLMTLAQIGTQIIPRLVNPASKLGKNLTTGSQIASSILKFFNPPTFEIQNAITLVEAYPVSVNDIQMSWGDEGYAKLQVEMAFRYSIEENTSFGGSEDYDREAANR
jgi:hypothetical protein